MKIKSFAHLRSFSIVSLLLGIIQQGVFASSVNYDQYDPIKRPDEGSYVDIYNACKEPMWVWTTWSSDNEKVNNQPRRKRKYHRLDKIEPGKQFNFGGTTRMQAYWPIKGADAKFNPNLNSWNGLGGLRIIAKLGCNKYGSPCDIGESVHTIPELNDVLYDHLYYTAPNGLYTDAQMIDGNSSIYDYIKAKDTGNPDDSGAIAAKIKTAIYGQDPYPQPSVESGFEASFKCKQSGVLGEEDQECQKTASQEDLLYGNFYDVSFVDGFTLPVFIKLFQDPTVTGEVVAEDAISCMDIDGGNHLPIVDGMRGYMNDTIGNRGDRPNFKDVCTMEGVKLKKGFFEKQNSEYNFESFDASVINPMIGNTIVGCTSPKTRLLMHTDDAKKWLQDPNNMLADLYKETSDGSYEYDSRTIQFSCPYGQGDLDQFKNACGFQCSCPTPENPLPPLCTNNVQNSKFSTPFDESKGFTGDYLPFRQLIKKGFQIPQFRARQSTQGANYLCHGSMNADGSYKDSDFPIENTQWVQSLRATTTNVYTYAYDDASGLRRCNSAKSSIVVVFCGDETFVNEKIQR